MARLAAIFLSSSFEMTPIEMTTMLDTLTKDSWSDYLNETFRVDLGTDQALALELIEVSGLGERSGAGREPFSLLFLGPGEPVLHQQIFELVHERMGAVALFLVPVGPGKRGMCYEAVFT
jgi:hypothetical protein